MNQQIKSKIQKILLIFCVMLAIYAFFVLREDFLRFNSSAMGFPLGEIQITENEVDIFLSTINVPQDVLQSANFYKKIAIYAALQEYPNAQFAFFANEPYVGGTQNQAIHTNRQIPQSDLTLSVIGVSLNDERNIYAFFPTFTWHRNANINSDSFWFALDGTWQREFGNANLTITGKFGNSSRTWLVNHGGASILLDRESGGIGTMYSLNGVNATQFQGTAVFFASPNQAENATRKISLAYAQDRTLRNNSPVSVQRVTPFGVFFASQSRFSEMHTILRW